MVSLLFKLLAFFSFLSLSTASRKIVLKYYFFSCRVSYTSSKRPSSVTRLFIFTSFWERMRKYFIFPVIDNSTRCFTRISNTKQELVENRTTFWTQFGGRLFILVRIQASVNQETNYNFFFARLFSFSFHHWTCRHRHRSQYWLLSKRTRHDFNYAVHSIQ